VCVCGGKKAKPRVIYPIKIRSNATTKTAKQSNKCGDNANQRARASFKKHYKNVQFPKTNNITTIKSKKKRCKNDESV